MKIENHESIGSDEQQSSRLAEEAGTKKLKAATPDKTPDIVGNRDNRRGTGDGTGVKTGEDKKLKILPDKLPDIPGTGDNRQQAGSGTGRETGSKKLKSGAGRKPKYESRAAEFRQKLIERRQMLESMRPTLRELAGELGTSHQMLAYHENRLDTWQAKENARRIRARAKAEGRPMTMRECCDAIITPGFFRKIEELREKAKRGPLNHWDMKTLNLLARRGFSGAKEILQKCRQMTPEEERQARASERKAMFTSAALNHIERIKQAAERGPLPWRDIEILKILARRKCAGAKELLAKYSKSALPRPEGVTQ